MKLYLDEHCPSCIQAEMLAHYHRLSVEKIHPLSDDLETRHQQLDAQPLPVLEQADNGISSGAELIATLCRQSQPHQPLRAGVGQHSKTVLKILASADYNSNCLLFPRYLQAGIANLASPSARQHFRQQKEALISQTFEQALSNSTLHRARLESVLQRLPAPDLPSAFGQRLSEDDVQIFPRLRNLTLIQGLAIPPLWQRYLQEVSALSGIALLTSRAC